MNEEELFGHAGADWLPCHLFNEQELEENEHFEALKKKAKK